MSKEAMKLALEALENNRQTHYYCEDTWYSCPRHEEGCANDSVGDECICGADEANVEIDGAIIALQKALAHEALDKKAENARELGLDYEPAQQEPVAFLVDDDLYYPEEIDWESLKEQGHTVASLYTSPPAQRKPLTDEQIDAAVKAWFENEIVAGRQPFAKRMRAAIEAAHGIKENT